VRGRCGSSETNNSIAQVARDLGINAGTLGDWVARDRAEQDGIKGLSTDDAAELKRLRAENVRRLARHLRLTTHPRRSA
jgi:transposase-like protein